MSILLTMLLIVAGVLLAFLMLLVLIRNKKNGQKLPRYLWAIPAVPLLGFVVWFSIATIWRLFTGSQPAADAAPPATGVPAPQEEPGAGIWEWLSGFDWNAVTPGKALAEYVGPEWVNWIMWPLALMFLLILLQIVVGIIRSITGRPATTGAGGITLGGVFGWLAFGTIVIGVAAVISYFFSGDTVLSNQLFRLPIVHVGQVKVSNALPIAGIYQLNEPRRRPGEYHVGCVRIIEPAWVANHPETPKWHVFNTTMQDSTVNNLRLTKEMAALLTRNGVSHVRFELTRVITTYDETIRNLPCPHLKWNVR